MKKEIDIYVNIYSKVSSDELALVHFQQIHLSEHAAKVAARDRDYPENLRYLFTLKYKAEKLFL
jgi:hypothetical protein